MGMLLDAGYLLALSVAWPWMVWRRVVRGKRLGNWSEKFLGRLPRSNPLRRSIWIHAVSVGEVLQIQPLLDKLSERYPHRDFLITTTTTTGYDVAKQKYGERHRVCYFPFDFTWSVIAALDRVAPEAILLVELELWPNFIAQAGQRHIPVSVINGRMTEKSYRSYSRVRPLVRRVLSQLSRIVVQNDTYAARFRDLGASDKQLKIAGSIKFDGVRTDRQHPRVAEIRTGFGLKADELIWIVGSTQDPEEALALDTYRALREQFPQLRLMIVPRHKERFEEVAQLITERGFDLLRRSQSGTPSTGTPVCLLDTLGELSFAWGLADIAFVGGSLTPRGGQNMIEPAGYGACVLFGPNTWNFKDVVSLLLEGEGGIVVPSAEELLPLMQTLLKNPERRHAYGARGQRLVQAQQGATIRTLEAVSPFMTREPARGRKAA
ncbi:MAG: 3-deoxy-D-manno-octulosonic acid transferase [Planctomycetales bacterium]